MAESTPPPIPPPDDRDRKKASPLLWILILVVLALLAWLYSRSRGTAPEAPPSEPPVATAVPTEPVPTAPPPTAAPTRSGGGQTVPDPGAQDWIVAVGPDPATLSHDPICLGATNRVVWNSVGNGTLKIYFPRSGFPAGIDSARIAPFPDMRLVGTDWVFNHPNSPTATNSGTPNPNLPGPVGKKWRFKYDQEIGGKRADGHMIIIK